MLVTGPAKNRQQQKICPAFLFLTLDRKKVKSSRAKVKIAQGDGNENGISSIGLECVIGRVFYQLFENGRIAKILQRVLIIEVFATENSKMASAEVYLDGKFIGSPTGATSDLP